MRERFVEVPGGRVWTGSYGRGGGPNLLVLHGGPGTPSYYLECLAALAYGRQVVFYDQLGCGRSERPDDPALWTIPRAVAEVDAVIGALGLEDVTLLGHSWGAYLALAYAKHSRAKKLAGLVLSSPLVSVDRWMVDAASLVGELPEQYRAAIETHEAAGTFEDADYLQATEAFYQQFFCRLDPWPDSLRRTFDEMGQQPYQVMWGPSEFTQTGNLRGQDLTGYLPELSVPSLWICGSRDEVRPDTLADFADLARGRTEVFEEGSHCLHLEQTERYVKVVDRFLNELPHANQHA